MSMPHTLRASRAFTAGLAIAMSRCVTHGGEALRTRMTATEYVIEGCQCDFLNSTCPPVLIGLNVIRLFFITYVPLDPMRTRQVYGFTFGGAVKVGWEFNYEPFEHNDRALTSVWGTCRIDTMNQPCFAPSRWSELALTPTGEFWANDVALMTQSFVRTSERQGVVIQPGSPAPAPL